MQSIARRAGLVLGVLAGLSLARSARADGIVIVMKPVTIPGTVQVVQTLQANGFFKCPGAATLIQLLNYAAATSDPGLRYQILQMAVNCCGGLSRELNNGQPWTHTFLLNLHPVTYPDLNLFQHTEVAQVAGRCLCQAIADLRDNVASLWNLDIIHGTATCIRATSLRDVEVLFGEDDLD